ncbi:MAG: tRNA pseudouridine(38-40) synthase TruA [Pseudomonadota bacterium]
MRIAMGIEYEGTQYMGWQRQRHGPSVQGSLETALSSVANEPIEVTCAGRTDTGVHGLGQVVHFDTAAKRSDRGWLLGVNSALPDDVSVSWVKPVSDEFHARFSAVSRSYRYVILNRPVRSALAFHRAFVVHDKLDTDPMNSAVAHLLGEHDFSSFRAAGCQAAHANRCVLALEVSRQDDWVFIDIKANAFLQHMVRNITGLLVSIGRGDLAVDAAASILATKDRTQAPFAAPSKGLYFVGVEYPASFDLPMPAAWIPVL